MTGTPDLGMIFIGTSSGLFFCLACAFVGDGLYEASLVWAILAVVTGLIFADTARRSYRSESQEKALAEARARARDEAADRLEKIYAEIAIVEIVEALRAETRSCDDAPEQARAA